MIDFVPASYLEQFTDFFENKFSGIYTYGDLGNRYVGKTNFLKRCNLIDDIKAHPFLSFVAQVLAIVFAVLLLCLLLTCCRFKRVSEQYEVLRQKDVSTSQIIQRNAKVVEDEERPQRRRGKTDKPDPNTFGRRSADEIKEKE